MKKDLEHKIKETFEKLEANSSYQKKDELWNRLESRLEKKKGVSGFWRVAAILFAVFFITGAIAASFSFAIKQNKNKLLQYENEHLIRIIDSLNNIPPKEITEIKYLEKEVPVYVQVNAENKGQSKEKEQNEILRLENEKLIKQLAFEKQLFQDKIDSLQLELLALKEQNIKKPEVTKEENRNPQLIKLKSENYDTLYQQKPKTENPKIKLQIFSNPENKKNFDLNTTILKQ